MQRFYNYGNILISFANFLKIIMPKEIPTFSQVPIIEKQQHQEIDPFSLIENEKTLLERFEGKAKNIAKVLSLITFLTTAPLAVEQVYAKDKVESVKISDMKNAKERANAFLGKLLNLPDNPRAVTPAQNEMMKKTAARIMIQFYALERIGPSNGRITSKDVSAAVHELLDNSSAYIDKTFGNGDGDMSIEEMQNFRKKNRDNVGLKVLYEMMGN